MSDQMSSQSSPARKSSPCSNSPGAGPGMMTVEGRGRGIPAIRRGSAGSPGVIAHGLGTRPVVPQEGRPRAHSFMGQAGCSPSCSEDEPAFNGTPPTH